MKKLILFFCIIVKVQLSNAQNVIGLNQFGQQSQYGFMGDYEIASTGQFQGKTAYIFHIMGRRAGFTSTSVLNDVKEFDNSVAEIPTFTNDSLDIISSNTADAAPSGNGARKVQVVYLDSGNVIRVSPDISLNGTTVVTKVLKNVNEVLWMEVVEVGSNGVTAGNIRLRLNGTTTEVEQITAGGNKSLSARFTVPSGFTGYINSFDGTAIGSNQDLRLRATVETFDRNLCPVYHFQDNLFIPSGQIATAQFGLLKFPALTKIKVSTISAGTPSTNRADVSFSIILIQN